MSAASASSAGARWPTHSDTHIHLPVHPPSTPPQGHAHTRAPSSLCTNGHRHQPSWSTCEAEGPGKEAELLWLRYTLRISWAAPHTPPQLSLEADCWPAYLLCAAGRWSSDGVLLLPSPRFPTCPQAAAAPTKRKRVHHYSCVWTHSAHTIRQGALEAQQRSYQENPSLSEVRARDLSLLFPLHSTWAHTPPMPPPPREGRDRDSGVSYYSRDQWEMGRFPQTERAGRTS